MVLAVCTLLGREHCMDRGSCEEKKRFQAYVFHKSTFKVGWLCAYTSQNWKIFPEKKKKEQCEIVYFILISCVYLPKFYIYYYDLKDTCTCYLLYVFPSGKASRSPSRWRSTLINSIIFNRVSAICQVVTTEAGGLQGWHQCNSVLRKFSH